MTESQENLLEELQENEIQDPPEEVLDPPENDLPGPPDDQTQDPSQDEVQATLDDDIQEPAEKKQRSAVRPAFLIGAAAIAILILVLLFLLLSGGLGEGTGGATGGATAQTLTDINLRQGPGIGYQTTGALVQGTKVKVVGRTEDGSWLLVETEDGQQAWMTGLADYVEIDQAALEKLPVVESAGYAYDASNSTVTQLLNEIPLVVFHADHYTCASHAGLNNILPGEVAEGNVIGPHAGDFAYAAREGNVLFKYTGGTFVLIRDNPIARFHGDVESLPMDKALQMFADGDVVWTGGIGRWPARGVPGCDMAAKAE